MKTPHPIHCTCYEMLNSHLPSSVLVSQHHIFMIPKYDKSAILQSKPELMQIFANNRQKRPLPRTNPRTKNANLYSYNTPHTHQHHKYPFYSNEHSILLKLNRIYRRK